MGACVRVSTCGSHVDTGIYLRVHTRTYMYMQICVYIYVYIRRHIVILNAPMIANIDSYSLLQNRMQKVLMIRLLQQ